MTHDHPQSFGDDETRHVILPGSLPEEYALVARQLLSRYGWAFVSVDELGRCIAQRVAHAEPSRPVSVLAHGCAAEFLYHACRVVDDPHRLEQGFIELYNYLERIAARRWPDRSSDIVQHALELTYRQIDRCKAPASFLAFARYKLLHAAKEASGSNVLAATFDDVSIIDQLVSPTDVGAEVMARAEFEELLQAIERLHDLRQRAAILGKYFLQQSDHTIAARFGITPQYLAVLRGRALKRLGEDPRLRQIFLQTDTSEQ